MTASAAGGALGDSPATIVVNIESLLSGDVGAPRLEAEALRVERGRIALIGSRADVGDADVVVDARGATVGPGLIDTHCHVVFGDYTPRQQTVGFLSSYVHGGITQVVSPGEIHLPGRPHDREGVKALALLARRSWESYRPGGMKVHGGAIVLEPVLTDEDFREVAAAGVALAKMGFGTYEDPNDALPQVRGAQAAGINVMCHSGGASIPGSKPIDTDCLLRLRPDVCGHLNGGPTSLDDEGLRAIVRETEMIVQLVQAGCLRSSLLLVEEVDRVAAHDRMILGSDTPTGTGVIPLGVLKTMAELCSLGGVDPTVAWAWASGTAAAVYGLEGGVVAVGRAADLVVSDAPWGSRAGDTEGALRRGDIPGVSLVMVDGVIRATRSRNTPAAARAAEVTPHPGELPYAAHVT